MISLTVELLDAGRFERRCVNWLRPALGILRRREPHRWGLCEWNTQELVYGFLLTSDVHSHAHNGPKLGINDRSTRFVDWSGGSSKDDTAQQAKAGEGREEHLEGCEGNMGYKLQTEEAEHNKSRRRRSSVFYIPDLRYPSSASGIMDDSKAHAQRPQPCSSLHASQIFGLPP
jgi:hypothetical protein